MKAIQTFPLSVKNIAEDGHFSGYASVFHNIDGDKDMMMNGAFEKTLSRNVRDIKFLWQHKMDEPIGFFTSIKEDEKGLYVEGQILLDLQRGREAYTLVKSGAIEGLSIGFTPSNYTIDPETGVRILREVALWEISLVTFPANQEAGVRHMKCLPASVRDFEHFLRDAGFSRKKAKDLAGNGWHGSRDVKHEGLAVLDLERQLARALATLHC